MEVPSAYEWKRSACMQLLDASALHATLSFTSVLKSLLYVAMPLCCTGLDRPFRAQREYYRMPQRVFVILWLFNEPRACVAQL